MTVTQPGLALSFAAPESTLREFCATASPASGQTMAASSDDTWGISRASDECVDIKRSNDGA